MTTLEAIQAPINGFVKDFHHSFEHAIEVDDESDKDLERFHR